MFRPTVAAAAALLVSATLLWLIVDRAETQTALTANSASVDGATLTVTLSSQVDAASSASASDFSVSGGGSPLTVNSAGVNGATIILTLADAVGDPDCDSTAISVSYARSSSSITASGAELPDFAGLSVTNQTDEAPAIESIETDSTGQYIYVNFCEDITHGENGYLTISAFSAFINSQSKLINNVLIRSGTLSRLEIQFGSRNAIGEGDAVSVSYNSSDATDGDPPQDANQGGKQVASWSARKVTNNVDSPPTLKSASALYDVVTLTFSEALDEDSTPAAAAFTLSGVQHAPEVEEVSISGDTVTLTTSTILHNRNSPTYTIRYSEPNESPLRQADGKHNAQDFSKTFMSSTPTKRPAVTKAEVNGTALKITFDLPLRNVAPATAFTVGGQSGLTVSDPSFQGSVVTLTLSPAVNAGSTITVSYVKPTSPPRIEGRNTVDADSFSNRSVTNNTVAPTPKFSSAVIPANGATLTITFTHALDEATANLPAASTFSLSGTSATVESVTINGATVSLSLSPGADVDETITVGYTPPSSQMAARLQSAAGAQAVAMFTGKAVTNNADGKPHLISAEVDGESLTISFDRNLDDNSLPAVSSFTLAGTTATVTERSIDGAELTLTLSRAVDHTENLTISYAAPTESPLKRDGKEILVDAFTGLSVTNTTPNPTPTFRSASIDASGRTLTIVMSHPPLSTTAGTPAAATFALAGSAEAAIDSVSIDSASVKLSLSPPADVSETVTLSYQPPTDAAEPALQSADGMWKTAAWSGESVTNGADGKPRPVEATVDGASLVLRFDRLLDEDQSPPNGDFTVTPSGISVTNVGIDGTEVTLTLSKAVEHDDDVSVSYSAGGSDKLKRDGLNVLVEAFSEIEVENDTPEPLVRSVVGDGTTIVINFSVMLDDSSLPTSSAFSLGSDQPSISSVNVSSMTVTLTLGDSLVEGEEYTLTYTAPTMSPLLQSDSTAIPGFTEGVANNTDLAPTVDSAAGNGDTLTISFDQPIDPMATIGVSSFGLSGDSERTVTAVVIDGSTLSLTLSSALKEDETASVMYTKPAQGGIVDPTANQAESFTEQIDNQTDTAPVPVSGVVEDDTIVIILDQELADDHRYGDDATCPYAVDQGEEPVSYPTDHFTLAGTDATIDFVCVSHGGPGGHGRIEIKLNDDVEEGEQVVITYFPVTGAIRITDDDPAKNRAVFRNYKLKNLTKTPPAFKTATLDGSELRVEFDRGLDPNLEPQADWFALESVAADDDSTPPWGSDIEISIETATVSGKTLLLRVEPSAPEDVQYELAYEAPMTGGLVGESGMPVAGLAEAVSVTNNTDYEPFPVAIFTDKLGKSVFITFDQRLSPPSTVDEMWFSIHPKVGIHSIDDKAYVTGEPQLEIALDDSTPIREGASVRLTYTPPESGGLTDDDGDNGGNPVESFDEPVENLVDVAPQLESITVNRNVVTLEFDQEMYADRAPPTCDELLAMMLQIANLDCYTTEELPWFTVRVDGSRTVPIDAVKIDGTSVTLKLRDRLSGTESVTVRYEPFSADNRSLRDTSDPAHQVEGFIVPSTEYLELTIKNVTPAIAVSALFDRGQARLLRVRLDGDLASTSTIGRASFSVVADDSPIAIQSVSASGAELSIRLANDIPECAVVVVAYQPGNSPLVDSQDRPIEAFRFEVANLIDSDWGLQCVRSDFGGLVLTFGEAGVPEQAGFEWALSVNGEARDIHEQSLGDVVRLLPSVSVCAGDSVEVRYSSDDERDAFALARDVSQAAPCVVSAVAVGTDLRVSFDQPLDPSPPNPIEFTIDGVGEVASVGGTEGHVLSLRLVPPGISAGGQTALAYDGTSLSGAGLTVGRFTIPIADQTEPPELSSAYAVRELIVLTFDQPLLARNVPASRFIPTGPGLDVKVKSVEISGSSVYLHLPESLPDEPELFGLVYLARTSGGLAGATGSRVPDSVFLVDNYTETPPSVLTVEVDGDEAVVTFDQRIDGTDAGPTDFVLFAGRRRIEAAALDWSRTNVIISLAERVTSLDSVLLVYRPGEDGPVRDLSKIPLAEFEFWAENQTDSPERADEIVEDARLQSSAGGTTFERELVRGFASSAGIRFTAMPGAGRISMAHREVLLSIDVGHLSSGPLVIHLSTLTDPAAALKHFDDVPTWCWDEDEPDGANAWRLGESDVHGVPTDHGVAVSIVGLVNAASTTTVCVLELITRSWSIWRPGSDFPSPSLILEKPTTPRLSPDPMLLAG